MYTMSSNLLTGSRAEDDRAVQTQREGRQYTTAVQQTRLSRHQRPQTLQTDPVEAGGGGVVVLASRWRCGAHQPSWTVAWCWGKGEECFHFVSSQLEKCVAPWRFDAEGPTLYKNSHHKYFLTIVCVCLWSSTVEFFLLAQRLRILLLKNIFLQVNIKYVNAMQSPF